MFPLGYGDENVDKSKHGGECVELDRDITYHVRHSELTLFFITPLTGVTYNCENGKCFDEKYSEVLLASCQIIMLAAMVYYVSRMVYIIITVDNPAI